MTPFTHPITPQPADIDELGHVNNAVWVRWIQDVATAHWERQAAPKHVEKYVWMVTRHEIDYRGNVKLGEEVIAKTWIEKPPKGARFNRRVDFLNSDGKVIVSADSTWVMLDKATQRPLRVRAEVYEAFLPPEQS